MRIPLAAALAGLLVAAGPAGAQRAGIQERLVAALDAAIKDFDLFLNCSSLDKVVHESVRRNWKSMVDEAVEALEAAKADESVVKQYRERADADKLMRKDARFSEMIELCSGDWGDRYIAQKHVMLGQRVKEILEAR